MSLTLDRLTDFDLARAADAAFQLHSAITAVRSLRTEHPDMAAKELGRVAGFNADVAKALGLGPEGAHVE